MGLMLYWLLPLPVMLSVYACCRRMKLAAPSIALILLAFTLYYANLYASVWDAFAVDPLAHATYVEHLAHPGPIPKTGDIAATRHPPTYYLPAAMFYRWGEAGGLAQPLMLVRHFSMMLFAGFILLSVSLLRLVLPEGEPGHIPALALLLFWPIGVTMGGRITCDILLYMTQAGVLLALARWFRNQTFSSLSAAFLWAGFSMLTKNTGVLMFAVAGGVLLLAAWERRHTLRTLLRYDLIGSIAFAFLCHYYTVHHAWLMDYIGSKPLSSWRYLQELWHVLASFNLFIYLYDTDVGLGHDMFWNMLLHSLLLGGQWWRSTSLTIAFHVVWFAILVYTLEGLRGFGRLSAAEKRVMALLGAFILTMIAGMIYMRVRTGNIEYGDGRYMYACVAAIAAFFGKAVQCNQLAGRKTMCQLGEGLIFSFVLLTFALFAVELLRLHIN